MSDELAPSLTGLLDAAAYPHAVSGIQLVKTHISWVFLTGQWAYKVKRPVHLPFADFRLLERRAFLCREELRLNRRFAPDIYRDVCAITMQAGAVRIDGDGEIIEYAVRMRQFSAEDQLDRLLASASATPALLREFGAALARIHETLPVASAIDPWGQPARIRQIFLDNLDELHAVAGSLVGVAELEALRPIFVAQLASSRSLMTTRRSAGRVRECHGDLHTRNIVRCGSTLVPFDCLEFEPAFRWIDVADEVAFLHMDLSAEGHAAHAHAFLGGYLTASGDYEACRLVRLYSAHRALVRAKVTALGLPQAADEEARGVLRKRLATYVARARGILRKSSPVLVLMSGLSGSGKTWLARQLAPQLGAVHVRSDIERKRLAGLPEFAHSGSGLGQDLYSEGENAKLYRHLAECASHALAGGYPAIVDATFLRRCNRDCVQAVAPKTKPAILINCHVPRPVLQQRLAERAPGGRDASEADAVVLAYQERRAQAVEPGEAFIVVYADTTRPDIVAEILQQLAAVRDAG